MFRRSGILAAIFIVAVVTPVLAARKPPSPIHQELVRLDGLLQSNDVQAAQTLARAIYKEKTVVARPQAPYAGIIIDRDLKRDSSEQLRSKAACQIAQVFYRHGQLELAKEWAQKTLSSGARNQFTRSASVLLGDIAMAMDKDDEAVAHYTSVINEQEINREQAAAFAGLFELLLLQKHDDLVEQWVRHGQRKFEGAGGLEIDFLRETARVLKRRNHPLWREINEQIVALDPKKGKLQALRELASNARKFGRWAEAEQYYSEICNLELRSAEETVNNHLFLAECQAKQGKDYTASIQNLESRIQYFATAEQKEYGRYRLAKFHESQGRLDDAASGYGLLTSGSSTSTWAAASLHQLAALKEKQGDLRTALQLYLQYPQRFPQNERLALQAYASALNVADTLGDANVTGGILNAINSKIAAVQDYNTHLNLAFYYKKNQKEQLAQQLLESGSALAFRQLASSVDPDARLLIHYRVLRRLSDFGESDRVLAYYLQNEADFEANSILVKGERVECNVFRAVALVNKGRTPEAIDVCRTVFSAAQHDNNLGQMLGYHLYRLLEISQDEVSVLALGQWIEENYPNGSWSNAVRLNLARRAFAVGDIRGALDLAEKIINSGAEKSRMEWIRLTIERAKTLRLQCLEVLGRQG
jgi:TolA-binding protein